MRKKFKAYTKEEDDYIRAHYLTTPLKRISKELGRSESGARQRLKLLGLVVPQEIADKFRTMSQFKKGDPAFNKGMKLEEYASPEGIEAMKATQFKKGHLPHTTLDGPGAITIRNESDGKNAYKYICVEYGKWELLHLHQWEKENGKIPKGYCLWFIDDDSMNCEPKNLELITRAENLRRNNLTDRAIASKLARTTGKRGRVDPVLRDELEKHPELLELKRIQLTLNRTINQLRK